MIHLMKFDMGGAAAVLGAAKAIAAIQPQGVQVRVLHLLSAHLFTQHSAPPHLSSKHALLLPLGCHGHGHGTWAWGMGHGAWGMGHGAWAMGHGAWGMGHGAWAMGHGAWGMGHGAWACENMVSGGGMKPGDIITASNGKTIEVNNTDAEGRLTLADALLYAQQQGVEKIVDVATLTGACIIALGNDIAGLFTPNDELSAELEASSKACGDKVWRMPMEEAYWEGMRSKHADMLNTGGREGGSITAALFLKQFVAEGLPWAHLDIAGPVWSEKKGGGTGFGASLLYHWVASHSP
ncbi:unnamed protein product [Closterium sp. NIES-54]